MRSTPIQVLIADDSALMRREIKQIIARDPELQVVGAARNGADALDQVHALQPDVVTLDINMPVMDGVTALQRIMMESPRPVVMLSSLTQEGALTTFECLELGAFDFVPKPSGTISRDIAVQGEEIVAKIKQAARWRPGSRRPRRRNRSAVSAAPTRCEAVDCRPGVGGADCVVAIGVSTGGPRTLLEILPHLPARLAAAVVIVQHMPQAFTRPFAERLNNASAIAVREAKAGDVLQAGQGYVARGGSHLTLSPPNAVRGAMVHTPDQPANLPHIPSVDVMMHSVATVFGRRGVGVLLTGMGADGADGMVAIRAAGGRTIAEHESTCVVYGMPAQAIARGGADLVLPCDEIAETVVRLVATLAQETADAS